MDFTIPYLRAEYFPPAVVAFLRGRNRAEACMQIGMVCFGSFLTTGYFCSPADLPLPFLVVGAAAAILVLAAVAIQWRTHRAFLATVRGDE